MTEILKCFDPAKELNEKYSTAFNAGVDALKVRILSRNWPFSQRLGIAVEENEGLFPSLPIPGN
jgi:hypothetical protein